MKRQFFMRQAATIAIAAAAMGTGKVFPSTVPSIPLPPAAFAKETPRNRRRRQRREALVSAARARANAEGREANRASRLFRRTANGKARGVQAIVQSMTNWQRNQWARAGYPGNGRPGNKGTIEDVERFAAMRRAA